MLGASPLDYYTTVGIKWSMGDNRGVPIVKSKVLDMKLTKPINTMEEIQDGIFHKNNS